MDGIEGSSKLWDAIIVGAGPAGLTAALMLGRYRRRTLVFDHGPPRNAVTKQINGLPGIEGLTADQMRQQAWEHIARYRDVRRKAAEATRAWRETGPDGQPVLAVQSGTGDVDRARCLLLATGVVDVCPDDVAGFATFFGRDIHHCPDCDGYEATGKRVAIVTWGDQAAAYPMEFLNWTRDITVLTHGHPEALPVGPAARLRALGMRLDHRRLAAFQGAEGQLAGIRLDDGTVVPCEAAFFYIGQRPRNELAAQLGCRLTEQGHIEQDRRQRTSVEHVYAAGDIAPPDETVAVALAQGQVAAISINRALYEPERRPT